jgi:hypothetical protein
MRMYDLFDKGIVSRSDLDNLRDESLNTNDALSLIPPQIVKLDELYNQRENLLQSFTGKHPAAIENQSEIDKIIDSIEFSNKQKITEKSTLTCKDFVLTASINGKTPTLEVLAIKIKPLKQKKVFKP